MPSNVKRKYRRTRDTIIAIVVFLVLCAAFFAADYYLEERSRARGVFVHGAGDDRTGSTEEFRFEIANDDRERSRGLMYRKPGSLEERDGMLFSFPSMKQQKFWMSNTYLPLDMIFLDNNWKIVGVLHDVPPMTKQRRFVDAQSQYVIELNAGTAKKYDIDVGDAFVLRKGEVKSE